MKKQMLTLLLTMIFSSLFCQGAQVLLQEYFDASKVDSLEISLNYEDLSLQRIYGNEILIEISGNNSLMLPEIQIQGDSLKVIDKKQRFSKGNSALVQIYLPEEYIPHEITAESQSGSFILTGISAGKTISARARTGHILAEKLSAPQIILKSTSAQIQAQQILAEWFCAYTSAGSIALGALTADFFDISTVSGDITARLAQNPLAKSTVKTQRGGISLFPKNSRDLAVLVTTFSGGFENLLAGNSSSTVSAQELRKGYFFTTGKDSPVIELSSKSGNISLRN